MGKLDFLGEDLSLSAEEFMDRQKKYAALKNPEVEGLAESEILEAVTGWIEGKFKEDWSDMCERINALPTPCLNVYCADYTAKEILNGGFSQAFFNLSRDFVGAAANGFLAMNYAELSDIIEAALKKHYDSGDKISDRSIEAFFALGETDEYDELDEKFKRTYDKNKLHKLAYEYIMHYKKYFGD